MPHTNYLLWWKKRSRRSTAHTSPWVLEQHRVLQSPKTRQRKHQGGEAPPPCPSGPGSNRRATRRERYLLCAVAIIWAMQPFYCYWLCVAGNSTHPPWTLPPGHPTVASAAGAGRSVKQRRGMCGRSNSAPPHTPESSMWLQLTIYRPPYPCPTGYLHCPPLLGHWPTVHVWSKAPFCPDYAAGM